MTVDAAQSRRTRARVEGTVQGVGFRPYVYRLAGEHRLAGFVLNDAHGVLLEVEGGATAIERFLARLARDAPPLAEVERVLLEERPATGEHGFAILESPRGGTIEAPVTPDSATCADCLGELLDPRDRRFRYPFINCTNCGPRFTIVEGIPYDRPFTTMAGFEMCARCRAEYEDPGNRRFHAQPNACPECGPSASLLDARGGRAPLGSDGDVLRAAAAALWSGRIVAVKGIGGYHLACRGDHEQAVAALRSRKHREQKPLALMVGSLQDAAMLVRLDGTERALLCSPERPIVLAARRADAAVAPSVAPGAPELGVMLAYSPLHHLLLADLGELAENAADRGAATTLVMTSGNVSEEPIAYRDEDALARLGGIADLVLVHDRPIHTRTDDSVVRVVGGAARPRTLVLRRSRGYVPRSLALAVPAGRPILACGAELKNTFCLARDGRAWVSHHIGDLENYETLRSFSEGIEHLERLFAVVPEAIAHDLHPEYLSTKYALERAGADLIGVQHHHAHMAACLAEHGVQDRAVGAIYDGSGYGSDGTIWGGELLVGDLEGFRRVGALAPVRLLGGERAVREPWRMACSWVSAARHGEQSAVPPPIPAALTGRVPEHIWNQVAALSRGAPGSPLTTSVGRLFDAVAALCGLRDRVSYEGQAAIELEAACDPSERGRYEAPLGHERDLIVIDPREVIRAILADLEAGTARGAIASRFHAWLAQATVQACMAAAAAEATELVVLAGGVFQNRRLLEAVTGGLRAAGLRALVPERLPVGDGGISYGQAAVAARRLQADLGGLGG